MFDSVALQELRRFVRAYPRCEKVLIVPAFNIGQGYQERLALTGTPCLNLRLATPWSLAMAILESYLAEHNITVFGSVRTRLAVENIIEDLAAKKRLKYFVPIQQMPGVTESLYRSILALRQAGITAEKLNPSVSETPNKLGDVKLILSEYEKVLRGANGLDAAGILEEAMRQEGVQDLYPRVMFAVMAEHPYSEAEAALIKKVAGSRLTIIAHDPVAGLDRPSQYRFNNILESYTPTVYSYLYDPASAPDTSKSEIEFFCALGSHNEIREVYRRILSEGVPFDNVEILVPETTDYLLAMKEFAARFGIPTTFGIGIPTSMTSPGRALHAFLEWVSRGFTSHDLRIALQSGLLYPSSEVSEDEDPTGPSLARTLAAARIGWGRERYKPALEALASGLRLRIEKRHREDEYGVDFSERTAREAGILARFIGRILEPFEDAEGEDRVFLSDVAAACRYVVTSGCVVMTEDDVLARGALSSRLEELAEAAKERVALERLRERILQFCGDVVVGAKAPEPGAIHVDTYMRGGRSGRKRIFIIGVDAQHFPDTGLQDPVLLDGERKRVSSGLLTTQDRVSTSMYGLAVTFAGLRGKITFSFSSWDTRENRENSPSSVILQAYRLASGKPDADYEELKKVVGTPKGYVPVSSSVLLDDTETWLVEMWDKGRLRPAMESVRRIHPTLIAGMEDIWQRSGDSITPYERPIADLQIDPLKMTHSTSSIEMLATCPRKYFFRYILGIKPPDGDIPKSGQWLDAIHIGNLMHDVFCRFYRELRGESFSLSVESRRKRLYDILNEEIEKTRKAIPPPGEILFQHGVAQLRRIADIFLKIESEHRMESIPKFIEVPFGQHGVSGEECEEIGCVEPVEIFVEGVGKILFRGWIDRIDEIERGKYRVWDYKISKGFDWKVGDYIEGGKIIQHLVYGLAAEVLLRKAGMEKPEVVEAGYIFPTESAAGLVIRIPQRKAREKGLPILGELLSLLRKGEFPPVKEKENYCSSCDYKDVCRRF